MPEPRDWEADPRPLADCLKIWHAAHGWTRDQAAAEMRAPRSTYDGWCAGRPAVLEGSIRRLMTLIDVTAPDPDAAAEVERLVAEAIRAERG